MATTILTASDAAWAWPAGVTSLTAEAIGGGGKGGDATGNPATGGGGKGGSYAKVTITKGAESTLNITVGGAAAASTIVQNGTTVLSAAGGANGTTDSVTGATALVGSNIGTVTNAGGNGGNGVSGGTSGAGGGVGGPTGVGGNASGGTAGTSNNGTFADGVDYTGASGAGVAVRNPGVAGTNYGGAGSGGSTNQATDRLGGAGAPGVVVLTYTLPSITTVSDNFDDNSIGSIWTSVNTDSTHTISETGGEIQAGWLGSDIFTGGDFSSATGWNIANPAQWAIADGVATATASGSDLYKSTTAVNATPYQVSFDWTHTSGTLHLYLNASTAQQVTTSGSKNLLFTAAETGGIISFYGGAVSGVLDNVAIRQAGSTTTIATAPRLQTAAAYNLTGERTYINVTDFSPSAQGFHSTFFGVKQGSDANKHYYWFIENGNIGARFASDGGTGTAVFTAITYSATDHKWLSIREASGSIIFETAPDNGGAPGTWTQRGTQSSQLDASQVKPFVGLSISSASALPQLAPAKFDSFNTTSSGSHAATGVLSGPGSALAGSAARTRAHATSGAPTGPGAQAVGAAAVIRIHATSGALTGPGSTVAGSAARTRAHDTSGTPTGPGATVVGSATRSTLVQHATSGALTGAAPAIAGAAARTRAHAASGTVAGPGAAVAGTSGRARQHAATGVLTGSAAAIAGTAGHTAPQTGDRLVAGPDSLVAGGDFLTSGGPAAHAATGALVGAGAAVAGTARNSAGRRATGGLVGSGAALSGASSRSQPGHFFSGVLAPSFLNPAVVTGAATRTLNPNKTYSIQDTFDAASIDTAKWDVITIGAATGAVSQTASCLEINQTNNTLGTGFMVRTDSTKDFAGSYVYTRLVNGMIASNNADGAQVEFGVLADVDSGYMWLQRSNGTLVPHWKVAGTPTDGPVFAYTPSTHGWLRVKEDGGTVSWQHAPATASDPPADHEWITDHTRTRAADGTFAISAVRVRFATFMSFGTPGVPTGPVRFDSVNIRTKSVVTHACTGALAGPGHSIVGLAARRVTHAASGVLAGPGAITVGAAKRGFEHTATGALSGSSAIIISNGSTSDVTRKLWIDTQDTAGAWSDKPQSADPWTDVPVSGGTWGS